jgi:hypothetical protein
VCGGIHLPPHTGAHHGRRDSIIRVESGAEHESTFDRAKPIALGLVLAVLAVAGLRVLAELQHVLILVFLAVLVASALSRPAAVLERHGLPRGLAVAVAELAAMAIMVGLVWIVVPPLASQLRLFAEQALSYVTRFHRIRHEYAAIRRQYPEAGTFDAQISALARRFASGVGGRLVDLPLSAAQALQPDDDLRALDAAGIAARTAARRGNAAGRARPARPLSRRSREDLGAPGRIPARQAGGDDLRRRSDVRLAAAARRALRRAAVGDRRVRRAGAEGGRVDRPRPTAHHRCVPGDGRPSASPSSPRT